jgi:hypothetical protein
VVFSAVLEKQLKRPYPDRNVTGTLLNINYQGLLDTALATHRPKNAGSKCARCPLMGPKAEF